jgi:hypothetical protein
MLIRVVAHSSRISPPLDLSDFGIFKCLEKKERPTKGMKGETWKIYTALLSFGKSTIIPMVGWSFGRVDVFFRRENLLGHVGVDGTTFVV